MWEWAVSSPQKMMEFYSWKFYILVLLLACVVTVICGHWRIGGMSPYPPPP